MITARSDNSTATTYKKYYLKPILSFYNKFMQIALFKTRCKNIQLKKGERT